MSMETSQTCFVFRTEGQAGEGGKSSTLSEALRVGRVSNRSPLIRRQPDDQRILLVAGEIGRRHKGVLGVVVGVRRIPCQHRLVVYLHFAVAPRRIHVINIPFVGLAFPYAWRLVGRGGKRIKTGVLPVTEKALCAAATEKCLLPRAVACFCHYQRCVATNRTAHITMPFVD